MTFELQRDEPVSHGIKRILLEQLDNSVALLTEPTADFDTAVHEARKNCKRIRAALRLIRDDVGEAVFQQENCAVRDVGRLLAPMRDSWVIVETLDGLAQREGIDTAATRAVLFARYEAVRADFLADKGVVPTAVAALQAVRDRIAALPNDHDNIPALQSGLQRVYRRGRRDMTAAYATGNSPELFHAWRKQVKYLWHQTEILRPVWPPVMETMAVELHLISTHLGNAHDLAVLHEMLLAHTAPSAELLAALATQQHQLETAARPLGERMYTEPPRSFASRITTYWQVWRTGEVG